MQLPPYIYQLRSVEYRGRCILLITVKYCGDHGFD